MPRFLVTSPLLLALIFMASVGHAQAQTKAATTASLEPAALTALRDKYQQRARTETTGLNLYYTNFLTSLELMASTSGDYELALHATKRREELLAQSSNAPVVAAATSAAAPIEIIPMSERFVGGVALSSGRLEGWRSTSSGAEIALRNKVPPGKYSLELSYTMNDIITTPAGRVPPLVSAQFLLRDASLIGADNKQVFTLSTTTVDEVGTEKSAGLLDLSHAPVTLRLMPLVSLPMNKVAITSIKLISQTTASPATVSSAASTSLTPSQPPVVDWDEERAKAKVAHEARLVALRKPLAESFSGQLAALAKTVTNEDEQDRIHDERGRIDRMISGKPPPKTSPPGKGPGDKPRKRPEVLDTEEFEVLEGARLVADPGNSAERFKIFHDSRPEPFWIRLAWVATPTVISASDDKRHAGLAAERFGATPAEMAVLANTAAEFSMLYLDGRTLQIHTRGRRSKDGSLLALVYVDDIGLFQNVLLDHGLAVVDAPPSAPKGPSGGSRLEANLLESLREHERKAKTHQPPVGGWMLQSANAPLAP